MNQFTPPQPEELNNFFTSYEINGFIAQGGMGAVYHGTQISLDRPVAVKILPDAFGGDQSYRVSFETEAKAMARLNHPNLVGVYDFGEMEGMLYIIMEYVPGRSLHESAHGQAVEEEEAARLILDICRGLQHAHEAGVIHRDIKPANVLIDDQVRPKIVDFGLARPLEDSVSDGVVFGTPGYTAPEVIHHPENVDQRSDIYSVGVMLYELLTGSLPVDPYMAPSVAAEADERFDNIVARAIQPDPNLRYASVGEMAEELEHLLREFKNPVPAAPATGRLLTASTIQTVVSPRPVSPVLLASSRKKSPVVPLLLVAALAVVGVVAYNSMVNGQDPESAAQTAPEEKPELEKSVELAKKAQEEFKLKKAQEEELRLARAAEREAELRAFKEELKSGRGRVQEKQDQIEVYEPVVLGGNSSKVESFDHESFINGLRKGVVHDNVTTIDEYNKEITKNIESYKRDIKRSIRKLNNGLREKVEIKADAFYSEMLVNMRIPDKVGGEHFVIKRSHPKYFSDQEEIDQRFEYQFSSIRAKYVADCEKKLSELDEELQKESIDFLKKEIEAVRKDQSLIRYIAGELPVPVSGKKGNT